MVIIERSVLFIAFMGEGEIEPFEVRKLLEINYLFKFYFQRRTGWSENLKKGVEWRLSPELDHGSD